MRLGKFFKRKSKQIALNISPVKKILAVNDEHFDLLYQPAFNQVVRCTAHLTRKRGDIYRDYIDRLAKCLRTTKSRIQNENKETHIVNFCVTVCFTSLYLTKLLEKDDFYVSSGPGDRKKVYLWLDDFEGVNFKIKKKSRLESPRTLLYPIATSLINHKNTWLWLQDNARFFNDLMLFIHSTGEVGQYSFVADGFSDPYYIVTLNAVNPKQILQVPVETTSENQESNTKSKDKKEEAETPSLTDLLGGAAAPSMDDLFQNIGTDDKNTANTENDATAPSVAADAQETPPSLFDLMPPELDAPPMEQPPIMDYAPVDMPPPVPTEEPSQPEGFQTADDLMAELSSFLDDAQNEEESEEESDVKLSAELFEWAESKMNNSQNGVVHGLFLVEIDSKV
ncbi:hypothetical protein OPW39_15480, partial [Vibrio europaeus]|uniref:hypothetical protein n=1 Tax=Vibrio europaeus TaxID=300876 RepID=UPI00233F3156